MGPVAGWKGSTEDPLETQDPEFKTEHFLGLCASLALSSCRVGGALHQSALGFCQLRTMK